MSNHPPFNAPASPRETPPNAPGRARAVIGIACWVYLVFAFSLWLLVRAGGDRWWLATVILFGPRWLALLPLAVLVPAALIARRRAMWTLATAAGIVLFPVMGLCLPWRQALAQRTKTADSSI